MKTRTLRCGVLVVLFCLHTWKSLVTLFLIPWPLQVWEVLSVVQWYPAPHRHMYSSDASSLVQGEESQLGPLGPQLDHCWGTCLSGGQSCWQKGMWFQLHWREEAYDGLACYLPTYWLMHAMHLCRLVARLTAGYCASSCTCELSCHTAFHKSENLQNLKLAMLVSYKV